MDELDALFSDAPAANLNVRFGIDANPDQAAESIRLARRYKLPVGVVSEFREDYKAKAKTEDAREVVDKSPALRSWIAESTQNAEISHDDVGNLSGLEQAIRTLKSIPRAIGSAFPQAGAGLYGAAAAPFEVAGQGFRMAEDAIADLLGAPRGMGRNVGEMVGGALREQQQSAQAVAEGVYTPPQDAGIIERGVGSGFQSATQTLLTLPIALRQGGEKLALGAMGLIEGGLSYGKARQAGLTPAQSAVFGVEQGVAEVVTESIPLGKLLGDIGAKSGAGQMLVNNLVREIPGELAATTWQSFNEWLTLNPEKSVGDWAAQLPEELAQTVVATLVGGGAQVGVIKGVQAVGDRMASADQKMQDAERTVQTMTQLDALAKASKVRQRDAVTFEEFIDKATEDGPLQDVYISGAALMQTGLAEKLAQVSQTVAEQIDVAVATGGDVRIPIAEYAGRIAGTDMSAALLEHLKTSENGLSQTEAKEYIKEQGERLKAEVERTLGETTKTQETLAGRDAVQAKVLEKLNATKRFTPDVNALYATQMANFFAVQAGRAGTTPEALFAQYEPRFVAESVTGQSLAQTTLTADESGMPEITGDGVFIGFSQPAERIEFIPGDSGEQMVNMAIMSPAGEYQGYIEATFKNGKPVAIYDIDVSPEARGSGVGVNAVKALLDTSEGGKLEISNILPQAQGFWEKLGIGVQNVEEGATYDGTITAESFAASPAGKKRRAAGRDAQGNAAARAGSQGTQGDALAQGERPKAQFFPDSRTIALLKDANLTSVLHESAHFYLEILTDLARTSPAIRQDVDATLKWFGIEGDENQSALDRWNSLPLKTPEGGGPAKEPYHEMWARGFEAFLFEGKSPSPEMLSVFQRFRAWMVNVYKSIKALNVELTDEVRGVFERMLATPEQIEAAKAAREMGLMFASEEDARKFGVDWGDYQAKGQQATEQAVTDLDKRSLRDMQWLSNAKAKRLKELQQKHEAIRKEIEREVRADVMTRPVYRAWQLLTAKEGEEVRGPDDAEAVAVGRAKLNTEELKDTYGTASDAPWRRLISLRMTSTTEGVSSESIAEQVGFTSGDEMVRTLIDAVPPKEVIQAETDQAMLERYGDITSPEALERAADEAVHNDMRQRVVATELTALEKAVGAGKTLTTAAKQFAQDMIAGLKVRDLRPAQYATAAARAGVIAQRALKKNDIREAATQKRNQLIQGYAFKAATKAQEEVDAGLDYLRKVEASKSIDPDYRDQIDTILERFDLKRGTSLKTIDKRKALSAWINDQEEMGVSPDLPPDVVNEALRKSYKDMTAEEFRGLLDSIKQIEHLGRLKKKLLTAKDKRDFEAIRDELVASIEANAKGKVDNRTRDTLMSGAIRLFNGFLVAHRKTASLAREMDGFKDGGPMWEYLIRTMNEAGDQEAVGREKATMALAKLMQPVLKGQKLSGKGQFFASLGISLNRGERLVMAMNTGNAGNLQRLLDGRGWTIDQIRPALDTLTAEDWQFVQSVWDFFESFRPQIAEKERRVMGKEPDWVEPTPVVTKFGTLRGGYYPVVYDPRESGRAENFANAEQAKQELKGAFVASTTRRSFTKTRAAEVKGRPLLLTMDALFNGANEVIHDLAWHEWVIDANRILRNDQIDSAIRNGYGAETMASLKQAVKDIAAGETGTVDAFTKVLTPLRTGSVVAGLGFNLTNALLQPLGITQSMVRIGTRWVALGIGEWAKSPVGLVKRVHEKSDFMRLRAKTQQRELNEIQSVVKGKSAMRAKMDALMFMPMTSLQLVADMPTWWGAYQKALAQGNDEPRSIELADQSVIDAQGAGQTKDLSAIQRGHPLLKLFTTFYGFFNVAYNLGVERAKATNYRSPLDVMHLAWDFLLLYSVPSVLAALIKEAVSGGDDDDEELARKLAGEQISFLMGQMVGLRELTGAAQYATGTKQFDMAYGGPAGLRFVQEIDKLGKQIGQGEVDRALTRALVNVAGVTMHLPSGQINRTIDGVIAMSEGKTENPSAILFGPPKE